jgi:formate-nitrite transporter family protein
MVDRKLQDAATDGAGDGAAEPDRQRSDHAGVEVGTTFERTVDEGRGRLERTWPGLLATGAVGGVDVSVGVFALLLVHADTKSVLLSALAFSIGFIALTLAKSELFTENFLVPIAAVVARKARVAALLRLWAGTSVMNLVGGWVMMAVTIIAVPRLPPRRWRLLGSIRTSGSARRRSPLRSWAGPRSP